MPSDLWSCVRGSTGQKRGNALETLTWAADGSLGFYTAACVLSHLQTTQTSGFTWDTGMGRSGYWCTELLGAPDLGVLGVAFTSSVMQGLKNPSNNNTVQVST